MTSRHSRRISIEAFSRATTDDVRSSIVALSEKPPYPPFEALVSDKESRGHARNLSIASTVSTASEASVATRRSSVLSEAGPVIYRQEDIVPGTKERIVPRGHGHSRSASDALKSIKAAAFRWSRGYGTDSIRLSTPGLATLTTLEDALDPYREMALQVTSFKMAPQSYIGYGRLGETLEYLSEMLPNLREIVLYSQVYTLEELNGLASSLENFTFLRSLAIFDTMDDPPTVCPALGKILAVWGQHCNSLRQIQFKQDSWWEPVPSADGNEDESPSEWTEGKFLPLRSPN